MYEKCYEYHFSPASLEDLCSSVIINYEKAKQCRCSVSETQIFLLAPPKVPPLVLKLSLGCLLCLSSRSLDACHLRCALASFVVLGSSISGLLLW